MRTHIEEATRTLFLQQAMMQTTYQAATGNPCCHRHLCTKTDVYPYEFLECIAFLILPNDLECIAHFQTQTAQDRLSLSTHVLNIKSENCEAEETAVKVEHNILLCI